MRKILATAALALAAAAMPAMSASAATIHHPTRTSLVSSTYSCESTPNGMENCVLNAVVTGPAKSWTFTLRGTPRSESLSLDLQPQILPVGEPNSALGYEMTTVHAPYTLRSVDSHGSGSLGLHGTVPNGDELLAWFSVSVPRHSPWPVMSITASR